MIVYIYKIIIKKHLQVQNSVWIDAEMYNIHSKILSEHCTHIVERNTEVILKFTRRMIKFLCYVQQKHITTELQVNASLLKELQQQQPGIRYNCEACASA